MPQPEPTHRPVSTLPETASVVDLAAAMKRDAVGCIVIVDSDARPLGVVTDRDLALRVIAAERDTATTHAAAIMSQPAVSALAGEPLERSLEKMAQHGIRRLPVVDGERVVGVLALDDLLGRFAGELGELAGAAQRQIAGARFAARWPRLRDEIETRLHDLSERARKAGGRSADALTRELDALRERIRRTLQ